MIFCEREGCEMDPTPHGYVCGFCGAELEEDRLDGASRWSVWMRAVVRARLAAKARGAAAPAAPEPRCEDLYCAGADVLGPEE